MGNDKAFWDTQWNRLWTPGGNPMSFAILPKLLERLPQNGKFLDVGTGDGRFAFLVAKARPDVYVLGVDYSDESIRKCIEQNIKEGLPNVEFAPADAFNLTKTVQFGFDAVLSNGLIEHWTRKEAQQMVDELLYVTKPGGHSFVGVPNRWCIPHEILKWWQGATYRYFPETAFFADELRRRTALAGFDIAEEFGVVPEWSIERMGFIHPLLEAIGKAIKPVRQIADALTNNWVSNKLGYEIFVVGRRPV